MGITITPRVRVAKRRAPQYMSVVRITNATHEKLKEVSERTARPMSEIVELAVKQIRIASVK